MDNDFLKRSSPVISSPYLNFDPTILKPANGSSNFLIPEGQSEKRGKMEMSFLKIGTAVGVGGLFGSCNGLYQGLKETTQLNPQARRTMLLNFIGKQGSRSSQVFGALALLFSLYDTAFSYARDVDDELNIIPAAAATGLTYSASSGLKNAAKSSLLGVGLALAYLGYSNKDAVLSQFSSPNKY